MEKLTDSELYGYAYDTGGNCLFDIHGNNSIIKDLITFSDEFSFYKSTRKYELNEIENKKVKYNEEIELFLIQNMNFVDYITVSRSVPEEYKVICFTENRNVIYEKYEYNDKIYESYLRVDPCLLEILSYGNNFEYYLDMAKNNGFVGK